MGLKKLGVGEGETVLEIGFGTGHCILALAESLGEFGIVYGIDISEGMRQISKARVERAGLSERVVLECADAAEIPFGDNYFDCRPIYVKRSIEDAGLDSFFRATSV